jgi:hypothetical protein
LQDAMRDGFPVSDDAILASLAKIQGETNKLKAKFNERMFGQLEDDAEKAKQIVGEIQKPWDKFADKTEEIFRIMDEGFLTSEQGARALGQAQKDFNEANAPKHQESVHKLEGVGANSREGLALLVNAMNSGQSEPEKQVANNTAQTNKHLQRIWESVSRRKPNKTFDITTGYGG